MDLLVLTPRGIYCPRANLYVDPRSAVDHAIITHAHSDHARPGHAHYLAHQDCVPFLRQRLGKRIQVQGVSYGEPLVVNGVCISLHPAGHILGSSQVRFEHRGRVWVVSGDYKLEDDGLARPFEPIPGNVFISECTFGLPVFRWQPQEDIYREINSWWAENQGQQVASLLICYALGKAQRILHHLDPSLGPIYAHSTIATMTDLYRELGFQLPELRIIREDTHRKDLRRAVILLPPALNSGNDVPGLEVCSIGYVSGWMALRRLRVRRSIDRGFVLSDHADWDGLNSAVRTAGAETVIVTHGYTSSFARWLRDQGHNAIEAHPNGKSNDRGAADR